MPLGTVNNFVQVFYPSFFRIPEWSQAVVGFIIQVARAQTYRVRAKTSSFFLYLYKTITIIPRSGSLLPHPDIDPHSQRKDRTEGRRTMAMTTTNNRISSLDHRLAATAAIRRLNDHLSGAAKFLILLPPRCTRYVF